MNIKELGCKESKFTSGHRACAGCGFPQIVRTLLNSTDKKVIVANATSCLEVVSTIYPFSSWKVPYIHSAFGNASSTISGIEAAYNVLKKKGKCILTTHMAQVIHGEPHDYFRFTEYGLKELFKNFSYIEVKPNGGALLAIFQFFIFGIEEKIPIISKP